MLKGKFPQTMWIGWVESNLRNPAVKFWANLDNPLRELFMQSFVCRPLDGTMPESVISQENNSPLTLYIEFHDFFSSSSWISIVQLIKFNHKWMHNHLSPKALTYLRIKVDGSCILRTLYVRLILYGCNYGIIVVRTAFVRACVTKA